LCNYNNNNNNSSSSGVSAIGTIGDKSAAKEEGEGGAGEAV